MAANIPLAYTLNNLVLSSESTPPQPHPTPAPSLSFFGRLEPVPVWKPKPNRPTHRPTTMAPIIPTPYTSNPQPHQASSLTFSQFTISPTPVPKPTSCAETLSHYQGILSMALSPNIPLHHTCLSRLEAGITELEDPNREVGINKLPKHIVHAVVTDVHKFLLDDDEVRMMGESLAHDRRPDDALAQDVGIAEAILISLKYVFEALTGPGTKLREDCGTCIWKTFDEVSEHGGPGDMGDGESGLMRGAFREKLRMTLVGLSRIWTEWEEHVKSVRGKAKEKASSRPINQPGQDIEMAHTNASALQELSGLEKRTEAIPAADVHNEDTSDLDSILGSRRGRSISVDSILGAPRGPVDPEPEDRTDLRRGSRLRKPTTKAKLTTEAAVDAENLPANASPGKGEKKEKKRGRKKGSTKMGKEPATTASARAMALAAPSPERPSLVVVLRVPQTFLRTLNHHMPDASASNSDSADWETIASTPQSEDWESIASTSSAESESESSTTSSERGFLTPLDLDPAYPPFPTHLSSYSAQHIRLGALHTISSIRSLLPTHAGPYLPLTTMLTHLRHLERRSSPGLNSQAKRDGQTYALEALKAQLKDFPGDYGRDYVLKEEVEYLLEGLDDHSHAELVMFKNSCRGYDPVLTDRERGIYERTPESSETETESSSEGEENEEEDAGSLYGA